MSSSSSSSDQPPAPPAAPHFKLIDGTAISALLRGETSASVAALKSSFGVTPGLAVILVGDRPDSLAYVKMKKKACTEVGITSFGFDFPSDTTLQTLLDLIDTLNKDPAVHGILVQLPLPPHMPESTVTGAVSPRKDVDGLHPDNVAALARTGGRNTPAAFLGDGRDLRFHVACTPLGVVELLKRSGVSDFSGKRAVVLGRSNLVGLPVSLLLMHLNCTVTIAHSRSVDVPALVSQADIVVAAAGKAGLVKRHWLKGCGGGGCSSKDVYVVDVGINAVDDKTVKRGYRLVGDVDFEDVTKKPEQCGGTDSPPFEGHITPVPGGVGPMTIAMLLRNTVNSATWTAEEEGKK